MVFGERVFFDNGIWYMNVNAHHVKLDRDWPKGLPEKLQQAKQEDRRVLAFFVAHPPGQTTRQMVRTTLAKRKNRDAITEGNYIRVRQQLDESLDSELAQRYQITRLPTMLILAPDGTELNRREGFVGEVEFRTAFLTGDVVRKPGEGRE